VHRGLRGRAARARAVELLDLVGIPSAARRLDAFPHESSGGMRQRAMIAIALAPGPKLLLADEPTTALDVTIQDQILKLLLRLREELAMSVILVTHDLGVVAETCDRVAVLCAGRMMETARQLLSSISALPSGCRFAPRCPSVLAACNDGQPDSVLLAPGHQAACLRALDVLVPQ
jgi:ABC-type dipeptide/oligopeptide/nickel transport system ATPase component